MKIALWNARSLKHKIGELKTIIDEYDIVAITETWLSPCTTIEFNNYNVERVDNKVTGSGIANVIRGGLCIIIKQNINYKIRQDTITIETINGEMDLILTYRKPTKGMRRYQWNDL